VTGIAERVGPTPATPPAAAPGVSRRSPGEAEPREQGPDASRAERPGVPRGAYGAAAPDPSGRTGGLVDVFA
jgi:hypothetical protein